MNGVIKKHPALKGWLSGILLALAFGAQAGPGDGIHVSNWVVSPYLDLNFTHDSNVYKDYTNEIQDTFFEPEIGLHVISSTETNLLNLRGNLFYSERRYSSEKNRDFTTYGDNLILQYGSGRRTYLELVQSYRFLDDNDRHASDLDASALATDLIQDSNTLDLERKVNQLGAALSRRFTEKLELGLSYRYSGVVYENTNAYHLAPKQLYVPRGLDLEGHIIQADGAIGLTDKTDVFLTLRQGFQTQEGTPGHARLQTIRLGLKSQGSPKIVYNVAAGFERYERPPAVNKEPVDSFNFSGSTDWYVTEKFTFRCGGMNGTQFSSFYEGNGMEFISAWAGMGYRLKPSLIFSTRAIYREDDYLDLVTHQGVTRDRNDKRLDAHARFDYIAPGEFLRFYLELTYSSVDSNFDFIDYVDQRVALGAILRY